MFRFCLSFLSLLCLLPFTASSGSALQSTSAKTSGFPYPEKLTYRIEWRLIVAGAATIDLAAPGSNNWQTTLNIESAGLMNRLYKVLDVYKVATDNKFCGSNAVLDAQEGKRHNIERITFDNAHHKLRLDEQDAIKNATKHVELDIPPCAFDISGALSNLRLIGLEPGKSVTLPITNGKKLANAKIEVQARESIVLDGKTYQTIRCEAFLFDNILYRRKGRLLIWFTDDRDRLPVQMRLQMGFPIGNVGIILEKVQKM